MQFGQQRGEELQKLLGAILAIVGSDNDKGSPQQPALKKDEISYQLGAQFQMPTQHTTTRPTTQTGTPESQQARLTTNQENRESSREDSYATEEYHRELQFGSEVRTSVEADPNPTFSSNPLGTPQMVP